jgi:hypothetical protein
MSNATARNTSASDRSSGLVFATGVASAAVQTLFLREYLTLFSGNEIVIGVVLALWLCAAAAGSLVEARKTFPRNRLFPVLVNFFSIIAGLLALRSVRLLFGPGTVLPLWTILLTVLATQSLPAFFGGFFFSGLSRGFTGAKLYAAENAGAAVGLTVVSIGILARFPNGVIISIVLAIMAFIAVRGRLS